jgi:predicted enzyme related to lactoylglutathione lyase
MTITLQGKFVWFELVTRDIKKAQTFYGEVFGWKVTAFDMPDGAYEMITAGDNTIGGYVKPDDKSPAHWTSYLSVADVDAALERVTDAGGKVLAPAFDVPTIGRMAKIADPTGATLWLYRGANGDTEGSDKPGTFAWNELITQNPDAAVAFYQKVAGLTDKPMDMGPMGTYHVLHAGETPRAGVMKAQDPQQPSAWLPYVNVDKADATVERVTRNGGKVLMPAADIPNVGRFAVFTDPSGAAFAVLQPLPRGA